MNIVLTGFMSSGKTVVGKCLSELLNMEFFDSDAEIEKACHMKIPEIFEKSGEEYFRQVEADVIKCLAKKDSCVISTGGGVVLKAENVSLLRENGVLVNLETNAEIITQRLGCGDPTRPLVKNSNIDEILARFEARRTCYDNCNVKIKLQKDKGIEETAKEILEILEEKYESEIRSGRK